MVPRDTEYTDWCDNTSAVDTQSDAEEILAADPDVRYVTLAGVAINIYADE